MTENPTRPADAEAVSSPAIAEAVRWMRKTRYNPISGLSTESLARSLDAFDRGDLREAALLWASMAQRDDTIPGVKEKREKSVAHKRLETVALEKSPSAEAHREVLREFWRNARWTSAWEPDRKGGVKALISGMQEAVSYRWAVHHIVWRPTRDGLRATFEAVPLWFFENREARLRFLPSGYGLEGIELDPRNWLISSGSGLMVASSIGYYVKRATLQDWLRFSEKFAMPGVLGKTAGAKGTPQGDAMRDAVASFGNDWAAVIYGDDGSATLDLVQADGNPASMPMPALIERVDRKIAALYRGADLSTMSSARDAEGTGASLQGEEADLLERADAADRSEELREVERTVIRWHFGRDAEPLAATELIVPERDDQKMLMDATKTFVEMGVRLPVGSTLARFGLGEADEDEAALGETDDPHSTDAAANASDGAPDPSEDAIARMLLAEVVAGIDLDEEVERDTDESTDDDMTTPADLSANAALLSHVLAANAVPPGEEPVSTDRALGTGANASPLETDGEGWYQISPYGEFPTADCRHVQVFGPEQAAAMVRHYNSLPFRITRWLTNREVPVFIGHPDVDRKSWPDERRLAKSHRELEAREDGLWGRAAWNALGRENLEEGYWLYPSPVWLYPRPKPGERRVYPDILQSVGLTNFQNIPTARAVTTNASPQEAGGENDEPDNDPENQDDTMNPDLIAALGLEEGASLEDAIAAISALAERANSAEPAAEAAANAATELAAAQAALAEANAARETAENALREIRTADDAAKIDAAIEAGRLTKAERPGWVARFETDREAAANALQSLGAGGLDTESLDLGAAKPGIAPSTPAERIAAVNAAVMAESERNGGDYETAFAAVKADPKMRHVFEAMKPATEAE